MDHMVIRPMSPPISWNAGEASIYVGMLVNYVASNGMQMVDVTTLTGDRILKQYIVEIPEMPLGNRTNPMHDYVYDDDEMMELYEALTGTIFFARCKDNVGTIDHGQILENSDVDQGMVAGMVADADLAAGATAASGTAAAATVEGEVVPRLKFQSLQIAQRAQSATESILLVEVIGN
jgi:hypothetical protein